MRIKKGDQVKMRSGRDQGKTGAVLKVFPELGAIMVEGLNLYKKRVRPKQSGKKGETVLVPRPFPASRASFLCSRCKKEAKLGARVEGDQKVRYCKKCEAAV